jgi:23S rRNA pseudouridine1911/1915/1917 synthase
MPTNSFEQHSITISEEQENMRVDLVLSSLDFIRSRSRAATLIEKGLVKVDSKTIKPSAKFSAGAVVEIQIPIQKELTLTPWKADLDILFEDKDIIVLNKPAGMVVHPSAGHSEKTLVNALVAHSRELSMGFNEMRPGIVHRLDKETSGLLVVAKNDRAHEHLAEQFRKRSVQRHYYAIVYGKVRQESSRIESLLARHPKDRKRFASVKDESKGHGKVAITNYWKIADYHSQLSLLKVKLETGRTHQIRIHLTELGHPIIGDTLYGKNRHLQNAESAKLRKAISGLDRIGLHAAELSFMHPSENTLKSFSIDWPEDLKEVVDFCRFASLEDLSAESKNV